MENELFLLSLKLRAIGHCLHFAPHIADALHDLDFETTLSEVFSDYLHYESDRILSLLHGFTDTGYDRDSIFGSFSSDS